MKSFEGMAWHDWLLLGALGGSVVLSPIYVAFGWPAIFSVLKHPATAAWVQAFGSIGAVFGAVWVAMFQTAKQLEVERRREREELRRRREGFRALLSYARGIFGKIAGATQKGSTVQFPVSAMMRVEVGGAHNQLKRLDVRDFADSEKLTEAVNVALAASELLLIELDGYLSALHRNAADLGSLHQTAVILCSQLELCESAAIEALKEFSLP